MSSDRQAATHPRGYPSASRSSLARAVRITVAAFSAGLFLAAPGYGDNTRIVNIEIKNGKVVGAKSERVLRGDAVVLRWRSDQRLELHLHGYDVATTVSPGTPSEMKIRARATGRFPVEIHGQGESVGQSHGHRMIFHLEVYPD